MELVDPTLAMSELEVLEEIANDAARDSLLAGIEDTPPHDGAVGEMMMVKLVRLVDGYCSKVVMRMLMLIMMVMMMMRSYHHHRQMMMMIVWRGLLVRIHQICQASAVLVTSRKTRRRPSTYSHSPDCHYPIRILGGNTGSFNRKCFIFVNTIAFTVLAVC